MVLKCSNFGRDGSKSKTPGSPSDCFYLVKQSTVILLTVKFMSANYSRSPETGYQYIILIAKV